MVGIKGTCREVLTPAAKVTEFVQVAVAPLVVQLQPLLLVGKVPKVVPDGICTTAVMGPVVEPVPIFCTVTGIKLG